MFLAEVLARYCPNSRIVLNGADLLFVQEATEGSLTGLMAISPFPMFPDGNTWLHEARDSDITTFADSYSVGEFNAVFSLLDGPLLSDRQLLAPQGQSGDELSAWLLVLGSYGWAPVKLLSQKSLPLVPGKSGS